MSGFDYSSSFAGINGALARLGQQNELAFKRQGLADLGKKLQSGDYGGAAQAAFAAGDADAGISILKFGQTEKQRLSGEEATRGLGAALQGFVGGPVVGAPTASPTISTGPTGSALPVALNASESGGNWQAQNNAVGAGGAVGHFGRAQFGQARLQEAANAGAIPQGTTPDQFMRSPELQKAAENWHFGDIDQFIAKQGLDRWRGQSINGVPITIEGMRNVAHLGGKEGLRKFISSGGQYNPADANGTTLMDYLTMGARSSGVRSAAADAPAPGSANASYETGSGGFAIPGDSPAMSAQTFAQVAGGLGGMPLNPAFQAEGVAQPWMGSALPQSQPGSQQIVGAPQRARTAQMLPPPRPSELGRQADLPAPGAVPAFGLMTQAATARYTDVDPNSPDGGARAGQLASEEARLGLRSGAGVMNFLDNFREQPQAAPATQTQPPVPAPAGGEWSSAPAATGSAATAVAARDTQPAPVLTKDLPRPTNAQEANEYRYTKLIEDKRRNAGALAAALANPNLPANARAVGEVFLKDALEQSKIPDSVKEFMYAKGMGWTTAPNPAAYAKEKSKTSPAEETEGRKAAANAAGLKPGDPGYQGFVLTGKMPREDMGPLTATDKKAILEADEAVQSAHTAIQALRDAKKLSPQALSGWGAGQKAALANNLPDWMVPDRFVASPQQGEATANLDNLVTSQALAQLKSIFGAAPTEGERKILLDIQGSVSQPENVRQQIYDRAIQMAERRLGFNQQRASELRGGDFYKSPEKRGQGGGQPSPQQQAQPQQGSAPMQGAKQAPDGNWYVADPNRPGKFLRVN